MRRPELVPLARPAEDGVPGQVREVGDGSVGVAARVRGLAAAVGLDPFPDLALGVGGAARLQGILHRHVPVGHLPVRNPLGADDPGEADVDHAPLRLDVQADAKAGEKDAGSREQPHRPDGGGRARRPVAPRDPEAAAEQVHERRVRERRAPEDLALVEEAKRDREREQREQVEVAERERPPQVGEADDEERAEGEPEPDAVDRLAAERARASARHRPGDLRARPGLRHLSRAVVDLAEHDLARLARPRLHDPFVLRRPVLGARSAASADTGRASRRPCRRGTGSRSPAASVSRASPSAGTNGVSTSRPSWSNTGSLGAVAAPAGAASASAASATVGPRALPEGPELVPHEVPRGHEHDRDRLREHLADVERSRRADAGSRGSPRARSSRRRGSAAPGRRRGHAGRGTSRAGSTCSCS